MWRLSRLSWLLLAIATLCIASCKHTADNSITVALFQAPATQALINMIPDFEQEAGFQVKFEALPYADLKSKVEQQFFAATGEYDVVMADCIWIPSFAERGFLAELDTKAWRSGTYDFEDVLPALDDYLGHYPQGGKRYGMPFMSNTHMMAYRPSLVEPVAASLGLSLPADTPESAWTWQQYLTVATAITKQRAADSTVYGTSLQARAGAWLVYEWYSVLFGFVQDENARITGLPNFGQQAARAMEFYAKLYQEAPKAALTWGHEEETSAMCSEITAMDATSNVELAANLLDPSCNQGDPIAFAYPPVGPSGRGSPDMGGYGLLLSGRSRQKSEASAFILWASSKATHRSIVLQGGTPIRLSEVRDPDILAKYPYLTFYDQLIQDSVYRARIPKWPDLQDVISRELTSVMQGDTSADAATAAVRSWVQENIAIPE